MLSRLSNSICSSSYLFCYLSLPPKFPATQDRIHRLYLPSFPLIPNMQLVIQFYQIPHFKYLLNLFCLPHYHYTNSNLGHLLHYYNGLLPYLPNTIFLVTIISVSGITAYSAILNTKIQHFGRHYTKAAPLVFLGYL